MKWKRLARGAGLLSFWGGGRERELALHNTRMAWGGTLSQRTTLTVSLVERRTAGRLLAARLNGKMHDFKIRPGASRA